ncbi:MAG: hypothetical protein IPG21_03705 [Saprospiraceae bacterium]|nr:hypothetical protein [Candidatus Vicinibacter affinis]
MNLIALDNTLKFNWVGPNNFSSTDKNPVVSGGGTYQVTITNNLNCERVSNLSIGTVNTLCVMLICCRFYYLSEVTVLKIADKLA